MPPALLALAIAVAGLFAGPLVLWVGGGSKTWRAALDGLVITVVAGLCLLHLGPHALSHGGGWAAAGIAAGGLAPVLLHRLRRDALIAWGGIALLAAHTAVDGAALSVADHTLAPSLAAAIVMHRLPMGLVIAGYASNGLRALGALAALSVCTVVGFALGGEAAHALGAPVEGLLEGLMVGGLLHVVTAHRLPRRHGASPSPGHEEHDDDDEHDHGHDHAHGAEHSLHEHLHHHAPHDAEQRRWSAVGAVTGAAALAAFFAGMAGDHSMHHLEATGRSLLTLTLTSAPALLLGFVLAGLASGLLATTRSDHLGSGGRLAQALRGVGFGLPLPICSCGVVPVYRSLVHRGVPLTAGLAFLVATPGLGIDAVFLSVPLLGVPMTLARVAAAFVVAVVVALIVGAGASDRPGEAPVVQSDAPDPTPIGQRLREGLRYGLVDLVDDTLPWIGLGLMLAALAEPLLGHESLLGLPSAAQVPLAALLGIPLYVGASGATPIAAMAVHKGLSAGAALTFLLAGPVTNVTTFGVLAALHGRALAIRFALVLTGVAILLGWGVDSMGLSLPGMAHPSDLHATGANPWGWATAAVWFFLGLASLGRLGARGVVDRVLQPEHGP